jgi:hypothetical protein
MGLVTPKRCGPNASTRQRRDAAEPEGELESRSSNSPVPGEGMGEPHADERHYRT